MKFTLGLDLGSISLKGVLLDADNKILFSSWRRVAGSPLEHLVSLLNELYTKYPRLKLSGIGVTGSGRRLISDILDAKVINEIDAHANAASVLMPDVRSIIEIGGQDSKLVILDEDGRAGLVKDFRMNELCAAGTGAFLDQQAARLGIPIEKFSELSERATSPVSIAGRCAVFAKTDMTHHQQEGRSLSDIIAGLNEALVRSYLANLVRGRSLPEPIAFQGGVASNRGLVEAFKKILKVKVIHVPNHHKVMGAIGAAISTVNEKSEERSLEKIVQVLKDKVAFVRKKTNVKTSSKLYPSKLMPLKSDIQSLNLDSTYLGIDIGSVSVKLTIIGTEGLLYSDYMFSDGRPLEVLKDMLIKLQKNRGREEFSGVGVTGSGRHFIGKLLGADTIKNEISAQATAVHSLFPDIDTIIEIGGQDAKFIRLENGRPSYFAMNRVCAAGTGAFLQEQSNRLHVDLKEDFAEAAFKSETPVVLGARCTVFMESDLVSHQQLGFGKNDLIAGLAESVATNYVDKVISGSPIGNKVLFLGGVAENKAVVSALEKILKNSVLTSDIGTLTGAIGVAISSFRRGKSKPSQGSHISLDIKRLKFEQFICESCPNNCRVTKTSSKPVRYFGGICGKWDGSQTLWDITRISYLKKRREFLEETQDITKEKITENVRKTIGIPRALMIFDRLPLWKTFFEEMGFSVVVSPMSNEALFCEGMKNLVVETCLPGKALCAHVHWLDKNKQVDQIFVPSVVNTGEDKHGILTRHCPYVQAAIQLARPTTEKKILNPVIDWFWHPDDEKVELLKCAKDLGVSKKTALKAWKKAFDAQCNFKLQTRSLGEEVLSELEKRNIKRVFVLMGKDYNLNDPMLNSDLVNLLEKRGETVITQDMLVSDDGSYAPEYREMYWSHGKEILACASLVAEKKRLYPILVTSFGCGPDAFTIKSMRKILGDKPHLVLEVDEHSSSVGIETRLEAFIDSLPEDDEICEKTKSSRLPNYSGISRIYLPSFSDHSYAFAAVVKRLGFEPVMMPLPDEESERLGSAHATSGECHPFVLMLGDYIKVIESGENLDGACYLMPFSGLCRVGQFARQIRFISEKFKRHLPVVSNLEDIKPSAGKLSINTRIRALITYWEIMRGMDFLMQKYLQTRAYEVTKGAADRAHVAGKNALMECILENKPLEGLRKALGLLRSVPVDTSKKRVKIGITGDYYTRVCDFANGGIFREIERMGGVIMLPPTLTEFMKYDTYTKRIAAINHRNLSEYLTSFAMRRIVEKKEKNVRRIFGDDLTYDVPLDFLQGKKLAGKYIDFKMPSGISASVAAIMDQIHAGADGILSLITFHCNYGLIINSVLASIDKDYPHIPKLPLIFEGLETTHNITRLEAFMERVKSNSCAGKN